MKRVSLYTVLAFLLGSCANIVPPSGGDKDSTPPTVIASEPANESVLFDAQRITIRFDEYVQLNDAFNQVLISPPLKAFPSIAAKGKSIVIEIDEELLPNTTYTIQFGSSIGDVNENNKLNNFVYAFSTGEEIDSLELEGSVTELLTGKAPESAIVVLYKAADDSVFTTQRPAYFSKVDLQGNYKVSHIGEGEYKVFGLTDQNFNYYYDLPNEQIAFLDSTLYIDSTGNRADLQLFPEDKTRLQLNRHTYPGSGQIEWVFSKKADSIDLSPLDTLGMLASFWSPSGDSLKAWFNPTDTQQVRFFFKEMDTVHRFLIKSPDSTFYKKPNKWMNAPPSGDDNSRSRLPVQETDRPLAIQFELPVKSIESSLISMTIDSLGEVSADSITLDGADPRTINLYQKWITDTVMTLTCLPGAFTDIFDRPSDSITYTFRTRSAEEYGTLVIYLIHKRMGGKVIGELMNKKGEVVRQTTITLSEDSTLVTYGNLLPDTYTFRCIVDKDENGEWTTGSLPLKRQPEPILYFPSELTIRKNWVYETKFNLVY